MSIESLLLLGSWGVGELEDGVGEDGDEEEGDEEDGGGEDGKNEEKGLQVLQILSYTFQRCVKM